MEIARRRSDRVKGKKVMFTTCKTASNTATKNKKSSSNSSINEKTVDYELNKRKAVSKKLDAAERLYTADCVVGGFISDKSKVSSKGEEMPRSSLSSADINPMARGSVVSGVTIIHKDNRLFSNNNNSTNDEDINKDNSRSDSSYSSVQMGSNILKEEIISLKLEITHKDKGIKQKDSQIYKLQTEVSTQKKELAASRAYAIKLENDIRDLEHSLLIQKQKTKFKRECGL
ncbi:unnamed protein product [Mytilus edulis]|uniref:Uncharacterized protein n=1 Tax=Mytilus edulis TaxID=6550 RepID=A0A8S3TAR0_MYTED|nr:unnamed protein product [Mytilus edulis]